MIICITGAESTGKTTLAEALKQQLNGWLVPEYARQWLNDRPSHSPQYSEDDLLTIAQGQWQAEQEAPCSAKFIILDTDLMNIRLWSEHRYGRCHPWILDKSQQVQGKFYLLLDNDIPWQSDSLREHPDRAELLSNWHKLLTQCQASYSLIQGQGKVRLSQALKEIAYKYNKLVGLARS